MGWERSVPISKLTFWIWVIYVTIGAGAGFIYRDSPIQFIFCAFFTMYSMMGFAWHCRELHVATLWAATAGQVCTNPHSLL